MNGQRHAVYCKTKAEARAKLDAVRRQALVNGDLPETGHKLGDLLDQWLATGDWKPRTATDYRHYAGLIRQGLGDCALARITPARIQAFGATYKASPRTALYVYQVLHAALELAVQWQWLPVTPADRVKRPAYHKSERELWTDEQCRQFLADTAESPWWQRSLQAEWRLKAGPEWQNTGRIFTNRHGGPLEKAGTQQALARVCRAVAVPIISPHCQRHLAASLALQGGVPLTLVSRQLGHASVSITAAIYGRAIVDGAAAAQAIGKALAR